MFVSIYSLCTCHSDKDGKRYREHLDTKVYQRIYAYQTYATLDQQAKIRW